MRGEGTDTAITARPVTGKDCIGCRWQARRGQRQPEEVAAAEYACENCGRPVCAPHLAYEPGGDWWICWRCLDRFFRVALRRKA